MTSVLTHIYSSPAAADDTSEGFTAGVEDTRKAGDVTAAVILIGDELLSGRTQDTNLANIAKALGARGIRVAEARVISDVPQTIVNTVNELRLSCDFVFTTGGIGPTHDDITAENIAKAFGVEIELHPEAEKLLLDYFNMRGVEPNEARMRMARIPVGATLVDNPVSIAPGFRMGNVFVMAGVPKIMAAMLDNILPELPDVGQLLSATVVCDLPEGLLAAPLGELSEKNTDVSLGSYPGKSAEFRQVSLVVRGIEQDRVDAVALQLREMVAELGGQVVTPSS